MLDLTAGRLADAIPATHNVRSRVSRRALKGSAQALRARSRLYWSHILHTIQQLLTDGDAKGKGKGKQGALAPNEPVQNWSKTQIEAEIEELRELKQDLALKVCTPSSTYFALRLDASLQEYELKAALNNERDDGLSAPELTQRALDRELNTAAPVPTSQDRLVNDLTSMIVKKNKKALATVPETSSAAEKHKAEGGETVTETAPIRRRVWKRTQLHDTLERFFLLYTLALQYSLFP